MIRRGRQPERFLATILFTDIVGSTDLAAKLGDTQWRRLVAAHHAAVRAQLRKFGGREVDTAGDGFLCSFDQPAQAVRAADAILTDVSRLGLTLRAGVHTGECEMIGRKIGGIAVHIAARVMAAAVGDQVLVSSTVRDLVAGSRLEFTDAGTHELKGVPGEWHLFALVRLAPAAVDSAPLAPAIADDEQGRRRGRRRTAFLAIAGIAVVALLAAAGALALGLANGPGPTAPLIPVPNSVVTIDSASGDVIAVHDVADGPVAIVLDVQGGRLWVASLDAGVVTDFALGDKPADRTTGRVGRPTGLAIGDGIVWVADAFDESVTLLDASTGEAQRTIDHVVARRIAYGLGSGWATDDINDRLLRLDRQSGDVAQSVDLGTGAYPTGLAIGENAIWVGNVGTGTLARIDPSTANVVAGAIALSSVPDALAAGSGVVWIAGREADNILRLDPGPNQNSVSKTIPVCDQPVSLAADGTTVWVGCAGTDEVWHLGRDGETLSTTNVGGVPSDIAVAAGRVYVTVRRG